MKLKMSKKAKAALEQRRQETIVAFLIGRTIQAVDLHPFDDGRGETAWLPRITLDDGRVLSADVQETEVGRYGMALHLSGIEGMTPEDAPATVPPPQAPAAVKRCRGGCGRPVSDGVWCVDCERICNL